ncbi:DUF6082 family protein [Streptomyces sp. NPDC048002]|uniref:DUF6082 family protein n=1 Tax=Streptomyces sp. NPDC048002 TaxID=3154344 RepID=UPI003402C091
MAVALSAVFSGIAVLLLVGTLILQQRELRMQREELALQRAELIASREELRRSATADLRGLHIQLIYEWGTMTDAEVLSHARTLVQSPAFRHYWQLSRDAKSALSPESPEGRFFRLFDHAIRESTRGGGSSPS